MSKQMSEAQKKYLEEYEKYRNVKLSLGEYKHSEGMVVEITEINEEEDWAIVRTKTSGHERKRTLHWCRKRLTPLEGSGEGSQDDAPVA